ncbi:MAG: AraC family transcriptional regulator [Bacilli bacterium]|jgi:AraC-like DNA-binding protein|nr:AraC family transcriptional regulator [Bacilli bacterium]
MDSKLLSYVLSEIPPSYSTAISVYKGKKPVKPLTTDDIDLIKPFWNNTFASKERASWWMYKDYLIYGVVKDKESDLSVILGPMRTVVFNDEEARDVLLAAHLDLNKIDDLKVKLNGLLKMNIGGIYSMLNYLDVVINHEAIEPKTFFAKDDQIEKTDIIKSEAELIENRGQISGGKEAWRFEQELILLVSEGKFHRLGSGETLTYKARTSFFGVDPLRHYQDRCLSSITLVSRAAMEGGMEPDTAYFLQDLYTEKIEAATNIKEMEGIQSAMLRDFSERMNSLHFRDTDNPTINRAISCIDEHVRERLTTETLASYMNVSPSYLSVKFKKCVGTNIPGYINAQKIKEAKKLLKFTSKPLSDIAEYLSFSTQSYFQNTFRKITGMTPNDYRKQGGEDKTKDKKLNKAQQD